MTGKTDCDTNACNGSRCCDSESCPNELIYHELKPDEPGLRVRVRKVACEVAKVCRNMSRAELESCFSKLFESPPNCKLFDAYAEAYYQQCGKLAAHPAPSANLMKRVRRMSHMVSGLR